MTTETKLRQSETQLGLTDGLQLMHAVHCVYMLIYATHIINFLFMHCFYAFTYSVIKNNGKSWHLT